MSDPTSPGTSVPGTLSYATPDTRNRAETGPVGVRAEIRTAAFMTPALSLKARGLYAHIAICHPYGYGLSIGMLVEEVKDGPTAVGSAVEELEQRGYLVRERQRNGDGTYDAILWTLTTPLEVGA